MVHVFGVKVYSGKPDVKLVKSHVEWRVRNVEVICVYFISYFPFFALIFYFSCARSLNPRQSRAERTTRTSSFSTPSAL